jgi:GTP-binding protein HflX
LFDTTPASTARVLLVGVDLGTGYFDAELKELGLLAQTSGLEVVERFVCRRKAPDAALFVGSGKADEIKAFAQGVGAQEILFDQALSPAQQRNLERHMGLAVNDRTMLILEIFAQRARSHEGKLQVELARLQYLSTRLVRRWSHLERQRGGIGNRGGPGETQIELDRRMISQSIKRTKEKLERVKKQRLTQRKRRLRSDHFGVSLVGYTNAGKSTLFNALVKAQTYAADQLFATLDTTTRQLFLSPEHLIENPLSEGFEANWGEPLGTSVNHTNALSLVQQSNSGASHSLQGQSVSLSDTVGFIRDLPHTLVDAFEATLQEAAQADLLLHVVDASSPDFVEQIEQVERVLSDIGADHVEQWLIFNKIDAIDPDLQPLAPIDLYEFEQRQFDRIFVSAQTGLGLDRLRGKLLAWVHAQRHSRLIEEMD